MRMILIADLGHHPPAAAEAPIERAVSVVAGKREIRLTTRENGAGGDDLSVGLERERTRVRMATCAEVRQHSAGPSEAPVEPSSHGVAGEHE